MKGFKLIIVCFFFGFMASAQDHTNLRLKVMAVRDTIRLDSASILPNSLKVFANGEEVDTTQYSWDYIKAEMYPKFGWEADSLMVMYRSFPYRFDQEIFHKKRTWINENNGVERNPFTFSSEEDYFFRVDRDELKKSGSISRGISVGNNQNMAVNSNLDLKLSGKLNENVNILASITDDNIPIQPEGNTQQLQDFDQVYIKLYNDKFALTAGDFWLNKPESYFMNFNKRAQGGSFQLYEKIGKEEKQGRLNTSFSGAVSKGKFSRNQFMGQEGNQGPYRLTGAEGETFIIILSGTERVFIDGKLLERGQNKDYVINYNTAELSFTPNQMITANKRITIEFQYSDKNYARSLIHYGNHLEYGKWKVDFNIYSEQDAKNQPLQQELSEEQKEILYNIGDSLDKAVFSSVDSVGYFNDEVLYKMIDSLGYDSVFVHSTNPDSAYYRVYFSFVGEGNGYYQQIKSSSNGRVFQWLAPLGGQLQGSYMPVRLIVTPKKQQMMTLGAEYQFTKYTSLYLETAVSNQDLNTFSTKDASDNVGYALKMRLKTNQPFKKENEDGWRLNSYIDFEETQKYFQQIQWFRDVEFTRDWNIRDLKLTADQYVIRANMGVQKQDRMSLNYGLSSFLSGDVYEGFKHDWSGDFHNQKYTLETKWSLLNSEGIYETNFLRHRSTIARHFGKLSIGVYEEAERNKYQFSGSDSLITQSFDYKLYKIYLENGDSTDNNYGISYQQRIDELPYSGDLKLATVGEDVNLYFDLLKNPKSVLRFNLNYRTYRIKDTTVINSDPEETILGRLDYNVKAAKGAVVSNTFYELGSGFEQKKEFIYTEVSPGQGTYSWIDYNGNGQKELNEYEVAPYKDTARYIRVYLPTNNYVRTYSNQFNQLLYLRPAVLWHNKTGIKQLLSKLTSKTALRLDRKTSEKKDIYNPFDANLNDSSLITVNSSLQEVLSINPTGSVWGLDLSYQDLKNKSLLTNGFDGRNALSRSALLKLNFSRSVALNTTYTLSEKINTSEFFESRNYEIHTQQLRPDLVIQPNVNMRFIFHVGYAEKETKGEVPSSLYQSESGLEFKYSVARQGNISANFNYIFIRFDNTENGTLNFDLLEGLQAGINNTWGLQYQRNLSKNMQLFLNYNGRKSEGAKTVHTGGMQLRAFF